VYCSQEGELLDPPEPPMEELWLLACTEKALLRPIEYVSRVQLLTMYENKVTEGKSMLAY